MVKDVRPLASYCKSLAVSKADLFQGPVGHNPKTGSQAAVDFSYYIFPEKGMENLGRHILSIARFF
jgi:hypothetical protein